MAHPALAAKGLTKSFGSNEVLRNIDFEVNAGRTIALCGENGAGKSTLIKLMTGVYTPSAGQVLLMATRWSSPDQKRRLPPALPLSIRNFRLSQP